MKKLYLFFLCLTLLTRLKAQDCSGLQFHCTPRESRCMATGSIGIAATGGSGSYNYKVTGPVNKPFTSSSQITGLQAGYYQVTVRDVNTGCTRILDSVEVPGDYQDPRLQMEHTDVSCAGNDGTIGLSSQEFGRGPFSFRIIAPSPHSVGVTNSFGGFDGLPAGEYFVQMTDSCGGIQVRRVTIQTYSWWFDAVSVARVGCDSADVQIRLRDNHGELNTAGTSFSGFSYGVVRGPGDTSWFPSRNFRVHIGNRRSLAVVARDACGNLHTSNWTLPPSDRPSLGSIALGNYTCTGFNASVNAPQNLTQPRFCLVRGASDTVGCNTTGSFTNIPYGNYCIYVRDACYDTTIQRCFNVVRPQPSVAANVAISAQNCTSFTATVTGQQNLISPQYCLFNAGNQQLSCNSNGVFENLPYGSYCIRIANGCADTTIQRCFNISRPTPTLQPPTIGSATCSTFTVQSSGNNIYGPATYCLYDQQGNQISCNSTGIFPGMPYGSYCVRAITACGDTTAPACLGATPPRPSVAANVQITNRNCYSFTASITGQQNLTSPQYCLYNSSNQLVRCNSTGVFDNLSYGSYCIQLDNSCYDTLITRCFSASQPQPSVNASLQISNQACSTFTARATGNSLTNPSYCLYNASNQLVQCNSTGIFDNLPYGRYCVQVADGCVDTSMTVCQTVNPPPPIGIATSKSCNIGYANVSVQFNTASQPYTVRVYHPNGSLVHTAVSNNPSVFFLLPHLASPLQYKVIGEDQCGRRDSLMLSPDATVVTRNVEVLKKCPSATWSNGSGDLKVTCSSNWHNVLPTVIRKNNGAFSRGFSSQNGNSFIISDLEPATYVLEYNLQNCNTKVYDTVVVGPYSYPTQGQSAIYQCDNNSFSLGADVAGGISPYTYQIIGSTPSTPSIVSAQQSSSIFTINNGTVYSLVRLRSIDACGNATLNDVSVLPLQNIAVTASSRCFYQNVLLTVDTIPNAVYTWYRKTTATDSTVIGTGLSYNLPFFKPEEVGTYVCKVSVNAGCLTRLSSFVLDGDCGQELLPVSWTLNGRKVREGNQLDWVVMEDREVAHYEVERRQGDAYRPLGRLSARQATLASAYRFTDRQPAAGINLYRIRILYRNGRQEYSNTISLKAGGTAVSLYPNPVRDILQVRMDGVTGDCVLEVWNASGQRVDARAWKALPMQVFRYPRGKLPSGVYFVRVTGSGVSEEAAAMQKIVFE